MPRRRFDVPAKYWGFYDTLRDLREQLKPAFKVLVEFAELDTNVCVGWCKLVEYRKKPAFAIQIHSGLTEDEATSVLIHEWAHAISWDMNKTKTPDHGPEWGVAYARVWRVVSGEKLNDY
jgi:hypothetical protein